jgi:hypothetical protein
MSQLYDLILIKIILSLYAHLEGCSPERSHGTFILEGWNFKWYVLIFILERKSKEIGA